MDAVPAHTDAPLVGVLGEGVNLLPLFLLKFDRINTKRSYRADIESFFGSGFVDIHSARSVNFSHVNHFIESVQGEGKSAATLRRRVAALRGFFSWLVALGAISHNPADRQLVRRVPSSRSEDEVFTVLTQQQARGLLGSIDMAGPSGVRDHALITTLLHCVLRRSEAAAMDFEHVRAVGPYHVIDLPISKGGANQTVKASQPVVDALVRVKETYGYSSGPIWRSISNNSRGLRLSYTSIYKIVHRCAKMAGIAGQVGAHTLRHTGCTLAIEGGATIQQVQTHARHKNVETTMIYVHQRDRLANSAADFIDL
jgi:site-specific recombinase XerD